MSTKKGRLFLVSGPSGSGKDTILKEFFAANPEARFSISNITRAKRPGKDDENKYHFISRGEFEDLIAKDEFLEYAEYCGNYYGTPKGPILRWIEEGRDVVVEVETQGAAKIMKKMPELTSIFILPPSVEVLRKRLLRRNTESEEQAEARISEAVREMNCSRNYDYIIVNDRLEDAVELLDSIVKADGARTKRNIDFINEVLENA